jgi:tRNA dimethylallyltransferase
LGAGKLRVICGPTAAGKTQLALTLAGRYGLSVISADSRQIYRGFDIGTAKPTAEERARVPHYGIDVLAPSERYSAAAFARDAEGWLAAEEERGRAVLIVGGTGFYIRALVDPFADSPAFDAAQRRTLSSELEEMSVDKLRRWCEQLDPVLAHTGRTQLLRAVETALLSGRRLSELHASGSATPARSAAYLIIDPGDALGAQIEKRIDSMLAAGWLEEVRALDQVVPPKAPAWTGTGYQFLRAVVRGELELDRARELTVTATRQYAKRQRTWFRHQLPEADVTRLDSATTDVERVAISWFEANA